MFPIPHKTITIVGPLKPKLTPPSKSDSPDDEGLRSASEDLMHAIASHDATAVMEALRSAFQILDSQADEPEEEDGDTKEPA